MGLKSSKEKGSAFENDFSKEGANEASESSNQKTQIGNGIEVGVGASTNASGSDQTEKLIHHQASLVITATCNSKLLPSEIQPVDGPKAIVLLILSIKGVHLLSTTQIICPSLTTIKYPAENEEAGNATVSTLQVTDQHVNVANLAMKGSELHNWMEPPGNDENQLLLQEHVPNSLVTVKESENTKEILKKKATKVSIPESTELASENVAKDVPESGNDTSFETNDLEEDLAAEQMVNNPGKSTRMHNDTLQAFGQSMLVHIQV
ncbi:unnamed protein product [Sphagnum balticum]